MSLSLESPHYLVLLALAEGGKNGLEVQRQIVGDTMGNYVPVTTIYATLKSLCERELAEMSLESWRKVYRITDRGRLMLEIAAKEKRETSRLAQRRLGFR